LSSGFLDDNVVWADHVDLPGQFATHSQTKVSRKQVAGDFREIGRIHGRDDVVAIRARSRAESIVPAAGVRAVDLVSTSESPVIMMANSVNSEGHSIIPSPSFSLPRRRRHIGDPS
jgi:hypothetical protein